MSALQSDAEPTGQELLSVQGLKKVYPIRRGLRSHVLLKAVDGVSFAIGKGETLGLVGESGSGKSTIGRCILRLEEPTEGRIRFGDQEIGGLSGPSLRDVRCNMQMVFQDPYDSLNPRMTVGEMVAEPMRINGLYPPREVAGRVKDLFGRVGLKSEHLTRYPHQLSGGQNQRVGIARALATSPKLLVLDEPTSALDVSVQAKLLNLLRHLQAELGLSYLFISHDLAVVNYLSTRVAVLYLGQIVEIGSRDQIYNSPQHPYTRGLISSLSRESQGGLKRERIVLSGEIPSPINPPTGCRLASRCPFVVESCREKPQVLAPVAQGHMVACGRVEAGEIG